MLLFCGVIATIQLLGLQSTQAQQFLEQSMLDELMEKQRNLDLSSMPEIEAPFTLDQIRDLRKKQEAGELSKDSDAFKTMSELTQKYGFLYEEHTVTTADGYILKIGRIPGMIGGSEDCQIKTGNDKPPIILQHGFGINMMNWVMNTNDTTPAFVLARACYDVWMPNNRGTYYSLGHVSLDAKKNRKYWDFTWEKMGTEDQVTIINHVLNITGRKSVSYMGHSQGVTQLLTGASMLPDFFNEKINVALLLAPVSTLYNTGNKMVRFWSKPEVTDFLKLGAEIFFILDFVPYNWLVSEYFSMYCHLLDGKICDLFFAIITGGSKSIDNIIEERMLVYMSYLPTDAPSPSAWHYMQSVNNVDTEPHFRRYDHGKWMNMRKYGQTTPPDYQLKNIKVPLAIFSGSYDYLACPKDVQWLKEQLNSTIIFSREYPLDHFSFSIAKDMSFFTKEGMDILNGINGIGDAPQQPGYKKNVQ